jgi:hypothetical protein
VINVQFQDDLAAGVVLVRPALQSPDFVTGVSGWAIFIDGSVEFNDGVFRGGTTVGGLALYYDGAPAFGNLIMSVAADAGADEFGNVYAAGVGIYSPTGHLLLDADDGVFTSTGSSGAVVSVNDGQIVLKAHASDDSSAVATQNVLATRGSLFVSAGKQGANDKAGAVQIVTSNGVPTAGNADTFPRVNSMAANGTTTAYHYVSGASVKSNAVGDTAEVWQTPGFNANWSGTTTFGALAGGLRTLKYRQDAEDNVWLLGTCVAAAGAGSAIFQLPAAYRPVSNTPFPVAFISGGGVAGSAWAYVSSAGNLNLNAQLGSAATSGTAYTFNAKIPLGNIA